jgi:hypothetical protein
LNAKFVGLVLGLSLSNFVFSEEILDVEYASFYSHIKKLDDPDTNALRFAFGFRHIIRQDLCTINSAKIVTQKQTLPLLVENTHRFTVPLNKILKMAKAKVEISLEDQANQCDMSVQLETLPSYLKQHYTHDELQLIFAQYQAFFEQMGGFLSFLMPSAEGIVLHFPDDYQVPQKLKLMTDEQGNVVLTQRWLEKGQSLELNKIPLRITALVEK